MGETPSATITLLGTGDAIGTPKIGCNCDICAGARSLKRSRLRTSILLETGNRHILIESGPDLRQQLLRAGSPVIDAVIWTHGHYDHFIGYGEFYRVQDMPPVYAPPPVADYCGGFFHFLSYDSVPVEPLAPFHLCDVEFTFFEVNHPPAYTCGVHMDFDGFRVAYTSDTRVDIPRESRELIRGVDILFVDALIPPGYRIFKHMNYREACCLAQDVDAKDVRCVHMSHLMPWDLACAGRDMERFIVP